MKIFFYNLSPSFFVRACIFTRSAATSSSILTISRSFCNFRKNWEKLIFGHFSSFSTSFLRTYFSISFLRTYFSISFYVRIFRPVFYVRIFRSVFTYVFFDQFLRTYFSISFLRTYFSISFLRTYFSISIQNLTKNLTYINSISRCFLPKPYSITRNTQHRTEGSEPTEAMSPPWKFIVQVSNWCPLNNVKDEDAL